MADLNALALFAKIVEARSFSEAARRLKLPVSTVSRRIAELEDELGVRLLERSTRSLRLTDAGSDLLSSAQRSAELSDEVGDIVSEHRTTVSGVLRVASPPSIADSLLAPLAVAFQEAYPEVRVQMFSTERIVDHVSEGIDLVFRVGELRDSSLVVRKLLTYRHQLVASPEYLARHKRPRTPQDLLRHRLLAFSFWTPRNTWTFAHRNGEDRETLTFEPYLAMNDYAGLVHALLAGRGIGDLPPIVQPELMRSGRLVEVMPPWRFRNFDLSLVHLGNRHMPAAVRAFKEFAVGMVPGMFPKLPA